MNRCQAWCWKMWIWGTLILALCTRPSSRTWCPTDPVGHTLRLRSFRRCWPCWQDATICMMDWLLIMVQYLGATSAVSKNPPPKAEWLSPINEEITKVECFTIPNYYFIMNNFLTWLLVRLVSYKTTWWRAAAPSAINHKLFFLHFPHEIHIFDDINPHTFFTTYNKI